MIGASTNVIVTLLERPGLKALALLAERVEFLVGAGDHPACKTRPDPLELRWWAQARFPRFHIPVCRGS